MKIELIYFRGCPHAEQARANLRAALEGERLETSFAEWDRDDANAPAYARKYASPTVLVDGEDVTGAGSDASAASCRADGAPSVERIRQALAPS